MSDIAVVGHVRKMRTEDGDPVLYTLPLGDEAVEGESEVRCVRVSLRMEDRHLVYVTRRQPGLARSHDISLGLAWVLGHRVGVEAHHAILARMKPTDVEAQEPVYEHP